MRVESATYGLGVPGEVRKLIRTMHPFLKKKIKSSLKMVLSDPYSGKALLDELAGLRSFRVSSLRIIYRIKDSEQIELIAIGPRERIYEETFRVMQKEGEKRDILKSLNPVKGGSYGCEANGVF